MNIQNIVDKVEYITKEWQDFADRSTKANNKVDMLETKLSKLESVLERPDYVESAVEIKSATFDNYLRKGETRDLDTKALSAVHGDEGGYLVTPSLHKKIISSINAKSPMRKLASIETISTNALDIVIQDGSFDSGWVAEVAPRVETHTPHLKQKRIMVHELYAQPKATQRLIDDSAIDIESWLADKLSDSFVRAENRSFILGDGNNQPTGILHYGNDVIERVKVAEKGKVNPDDILNLINSLSDEYLSNATLLMHRSTLSALQRLRDGNGRFIWQPSMTESTPETLFGIPVMCAGDIPILKGDTDAMVLADFKAAYKIVDRAGMGLMRDPYTDKPFIKFYAVKRVGGDVVESNAVKILRT